ncbi:MAG TPA: alanine--tRNA ligase [Oscillatoriaceae cyanobacterium]
MPAIAGQTSALNEGETVKALTGKEIRQKYIEFFEAKGHKHLPSSSLIPHNDPTLLLTVAGMVQFKPIFMGAEPPKFTRVTTCQKCIRTGDLENVGRTARHHTFFQMLGNFSFGDYFKAEVIPWAWEFVTGVLGLPAERLWISIFETDDESFRIWQQAGVPAERIVRLGEDDNFWAAGPTGPCGPCSEIYYDLGPEFGCSGNPNAKLGEDDTRFLEFWNLVFMEFNRDEAGVLTPLPKKNIDTGMGLERIAAIMQRVPNNFETDLLKPMLLRAAEIADVPYGKAPASDVSLKVITDHLRASAFMIADGIVPSNEGRGYVLRRIIRRAYRHGRLLGVQRPFLNTMVPLVVDLYGDFYPEIADRQKVITETLLAEEERFGATIDRGMALLDDALTHVGAHKELSGKVAFELHDTYGFPLDLTIELAGERGINVDLREFESEMEQQRERARSAREAAGIRFDAEVASSATSEFLGYEKIAEVDTVADVLDLGKGKKGVILNRTPFYAESGGQVGDTGVLVHVRGAEQALTFGNYADRVAAADVVRVLDTQKRHGAIVHVVPADAAVQVGDRLYALVDEPRRSAIRRHHSATHLLHAALRDVLGTHVTQAGSLVGPDYLRFDFTLARAMTPEEIQRVEQLVNEKVLENLPVETAVMSFDEARGSGAMALFGEKYGDSVRVLTMGPFSKELCGGTHVSRTGDIGLVKVTGESGIAAGVRRIEAVAGMAAYKLVSEMAQAVAGLGDRLKAPVGELPERVDRLQDQLKGAEKQVKALQGQLAVAQSERLLAQAAEVDGVRYIAASVTDMAADAAREAVGALSRELGTGVVLLASVTGGKVSAVCAVSDDLTATLKAGDVLAAFMARIGGRGSGKANFAQGGGGNPEAVPAAVQDFAAIVREVKGSVKA